MDSFACLGVSFELPIMECPSPPGLSRPGHVTPWPREYWHWLPVTVTVAQRLETGPAAPGRRVTHDRRGPGDQAPRLAGADSEPRLSCRQPVCGQCAGGHGDADGHGVAPATVPGSHGHGGAGHWHWHSDSAMRRPNLNFRVRRPGPGPLRVRPRLFTDSEVEEAAFQKPFENDALSAK